MNIPVPDNSRHNAELPDNRVPHRNLPLVVIVGINGRQGTSVAKAFLENGSYRIRGLTSSPDCSSSENWKRLGVEIREETYMEFQHVHASFEGANIIFASTCYHKVLTNRRASMAFQVGMMGNKGVSQYAMERDINTGHMILDAAAEIPELQRFVMSTLPILQSEVEYATNKAMGESAAKVEHIIHLQHVLPDQWKKTILVKPSPRMEDLDSALRMVSFAVPRKLHARPVPGQKGKTQPAIQLGDGTLSFGTTAPAEASFFWLNMRKDFGVQVRTLVEYLPFSAYAFASYSDRLSGEEICHLISKISGRTCTYNQVQYEDIEQRDRDTLFRLLPLPLGSLLYDQDIFTPTSFNETFKQHNISVTQTSFEEYLTAVLPGKLHQLRCISSDSPTHVHEVGLESITPDMRKVLQENQDMLYGVGPESSGQSKVLQDDQDELDGVDLESMTPGLRKVLQENQDVLDGMEEVIDKDIIDVTQGGQSKGSSSTAGHAPSMKRSPFGAGQDPFKKLSPFKKGSPFKDGQDPFKKDSPFKTGEDPFMGVAAEDTIRECMELFELDPDKTKSLRKDFGFKR